MIFVLETAPGGQDTPEQIEQRVQGRRTVLYFHDAETMAKQFFKNPAARWSHFILDDGSLCFPVGNGVWYSQGTIDVPADSGMADTYHWMELFLPNSHTPLFIKIGDTNWGDYDAALRQAGLSDPSRGAAR